MIPEFCQQKGAPYKMRKLLPPGDYPCTLSQMQQRFVTDVRKPEKRQELFSQFMAYRDRCISCGLAGEHWIDGSFVSGVDRPGDIDAITFVLPGVLRSIHADHRQEVDDLLDLKKAKDSYSFHHRLIVCYDLTDNEFSKASFNAKEWIDDFGKTLDWKDMYGMQRPGYHKGIIRIAFGESSKVPNVHEWLKLQLADNLSERGGIKHER